MASLFPLLRYYIRYRFRGAGQYPSTWLRNLYHDYDGKVVLAKDIHATQGKFILAFSFFDLNELPSIDPSPGGLYVFSSSEPHDEEQEIDFRRLHNWLDHFSIRGFGLPIETDGEWSIPEEERGLHASGHACGTDLLSIAREINPDILIPVHSQNPEVYQESFKGSEVRVVLLQLNEAIQL